MSSSDTLNVRVIAPMSLAPLQPVYTTRYKINSPLWNSRIKALITHWIPHCCDEISDPNLKTGGIENFIQAGNKSAGRPYTRHIGYPFSNAWVHNTVESMCVALMVDPQGDPDIIKAQDAMRAKLNEWIPIILSAGARWLSPDSFHAWNGGRTRRFQPAALEPSLPRRARGIYGWILHRVGMR